MALGVEDEARGGHVPTIPSGRHPRANSFRLCLAILWRNKSFAPEDAIVELVIFGLAFPLLAYVTPLRARPLTLTVHRSVAEMWLLFACVIGVTLYLVWGAALSEALVPTSWLVSERQKFFVVFARKLIVFVAIPFVLFRAVFGY
jgi:hypothetical protein